MSDTRLKEAQAAFNDGDVEASRMVHEKTRADEEHQAGGDFVKSIVYGGLDGIVTMFSIVAGVVGAEQTLFVLFIVSISGLVADAIAMGMGDYVSEAAEIQYAAAERKREMWETENYEAGEFSEMVEIYEGKGLSHEDAYRVVELLLKNRDLFVDTMMVEELGISGWDDEDPWRNGLVTFGSFIGFGLVPLFAYFLSFAMHGFSDFTVTLDLYFVLSGILTMATMFGLGSFASRWSAEPFWRMGLMLSLLGAVAALASFAVAFGLESTTA